MNREDAKVGDFITFQGTHGNVWTAKVVGKGDSYLTYEASDGVLAREEDTIFDNYDLDDYRPATEDEIAEWRRSYRPAPQNWF